MVAPSEVNVRFVLDLEKRTKGASSRSKKDGDDVGIPNYRYMRPSASQREMGALVLPKLSNLLALLPLCEFRKTFPQAFKVARLYLAYCSLPALSLHMSCGQGQTEKAPPAPPPFSSLFEIPYTFSAEFAPNIFAFT